MLEECCVFVVVVRADLDENRLEITPKLVRDALDFVHQMLQLLDPVSAVARDHAKRLVEIGQELDVLRVQQHLALLEQSLDRLVVGQLAHKRAIDLQALALLVQGVVVLHHEHFQRYSLGVVGLQLQHGFQQLQGLLVSHQVVALHSHSDQQRYVRGLPVQGALEQHHGLADLRLPAQGGCFLDLPLRFPLLSLPLEPNLGVGRRFNLAEALLES